MIRPAPPLALALRSPLALLAGLRRPRRRRPRRAAPRERVAVLRQRPGRLALLAPRRDHARERRAPRGGLDAPHRRRLRRARARRSTTAFENTPILVDGTLFLCSPLQPGHRPRPADGRGALELRPEDPARRSLRQPADLPRRLDLARRRRRPPAPPCRRRILTATNDARLLALDAATGAPLRRVRRPRERRPEPRRRRAALARRVPGDLAARGRSATSSSSARRSATTSAGTRRAA